MPKPVLPIRLMAPLVLVAAFGLAACSHTAGDFSKRTAVATHEPMDLASPAADSQAAAAPADATPVNVGTIDAAAGPQPAPVKPKKPAKVAAEPPEPALAPAAFAEPKAEPETAPVAVKTVRDDGFPNISAPPPEPSGKLLSPEERARVIAELEALKNRQGVAPQKQPAKKCTAEQIADGVKGCPAPAN